MDSFADFVEELRPCDSDDDVDDNDHGQEQAGEESDTESVIDNQDAKPQSDQVKVAIIDDGVKSNVDGLNKIIERGESWARQGNARSAKRRYSPYTISSTGHGTVMAYYIRRMCPSVGLWVAKLDPDVVQGRITFTIESATKVRKSGSAVALYRD